MAAPKRTKIEVARDRLIIAERYCKGESQYVIAASMGLSRQQIGYDIDKIMDAWKREAVLDIDAAKAREIQKLNRLEVTYWEAWERSKQPREKTQTRKVDADKPRMEAGIQREEKRDGNPAFLDGVLKCIDRRCKILGLDAPFQLNLTDEARRVAKEFGLPESDVPQLVAEAQAVVPLLLAGPRR